MPPIGRRSVLQSAARCTAISITNYFDEVVDQLGRAGISVDSVAIDLSPAEPMRGQLTTGLGPVLRWREDLGWTSGARSAGPAAHPGEVARLLA
ncbi:hypothetical protein Lesp02_39450 [Lentzea sp. NBRC 105346]|uniref:hypothetical protein n=1 Tax=Lentzea sp. NBRC 105346 TaxID=3032205 RepID=UPI0024A47850|nr:hypothetical protein [Lentzea sp. NBRC 105346]GLZ31757.1 hypothetical protein Lesp02_39450 [Lentzea sp. NBRC 105346]